MVLVYASPPVSAPSKLVAAWESITVEWLGADGTRWDLATGLHGVVLSADGTRGMHEPVLIGFDSESPAIHGSRPRGWRAPARDVRWPIRVFHDSSLAWADTYTRFFDSIDPDVDGRWRVGFNGQVRELRCRGRYREGHDFGTHPTVLGWGKFGVELIAHQPFWEGEPIKRGPWKAPDPTPFFPGPPFHLSAGSAFGTATVPNPGQLPVWLTWGADGPFTALSVGAGGKVTDIPFEIPAGKRLMIDTDPRNVTALLGDIPDDGEPFAGDDITEDLGFQSYAPVERGSSVPVHVAGTGAGQVWCELIPLYRRAM